MEINDFYSFGSKFSSSTFQAHPKYLNRINMNYPNYSDTKCLHQGIYEGMDFPVIFEQYSGSKFRDILDTGSANLNIISGKFKQVLEENNLTGWKTYPITIFDRKDTEIKGYYGFSITGRCGPIDCSKSQIVEKQLVPNAPFAKYLVGQYVGLDTWDGSDFFLSEGNFSTIVSNRASTVIKENKLSNVRLINLLDIEIPVHGIPKEYRNKLEGDGLL